MKDKTFNIHDASSTQTADILGITRQRVSQLRSQGVINNNGRRGRYDVPQAIKDYAAYLADNGGGDIQTALIVQRTRKLRIENDRAEAKLIDVDDAAKVFFAAVDQYLAMTADLPKRLAPKLARMQTVAQIRRTIDKGFDVERKKLVAEFLKFFRDAGFDVDGAVKGGKVRKTS